MFLETLGSKSMPNAALIADVASVLRYFMRSNACVLSSRLLRCQFKTKKGETLCTLDRGDSRSCVSRLELLGKILSSTIKKNVLLIASTDLLEVGELVLELEVLRINN